MYILACLCSTVHKHCRLAIAKTYVVVEPVCLA